MRTETATPAQVLAITDQRHLGGIESEAALSVPALEEITVPTDVLRAARLCCERPKPYGGRRQLQGVYVHRTADGFVRVVGTDGNRLLVANVYREFADREGAAWLTKGVIIPADQLETRLSLLTKSGGKCVISYAEGAPHVELSSLGGDCSFKLQPIDTEFPDYGRIMAGWGGSFTERERGDYVPTAFDVKHFKSVGDIAQRLDVMTIDAYAAPFKPTGKTSVSSEPAVFTFGKGVALFVSSKASAGVMTDADRTLLAPAIKASIGALRAHETRHRKAAKKATGAAKAAEIEKADGYKAKIEAMMQRVGTGSVAAAIAAPVPPPPPVINDAIDDNAVVGDEGPTREQVEAAEPVSAAPPAPEPEKPVKAKRAVVRQGARKGGRTKKARR